MRASVSQYELWSDCPRKWWFERVAGLGAEFSYPFGTVTHSCMERRLLGKEVFPEGWEECYDKWTGKSSGSVGPRDQALIRTLIKRAEDAGFFNVITPFEVEKKFEANVDGISVIGFIDLVEPGIVTDHKTIGKLKYCETTESLAENVQLLVYAHVTGARVLRHNVLSQDPVTAHRVEAKVSDQQVEDMWGKFVDGLLQMRVDRAKTVALDVLGNERHCNAYGKRCAFYDKCHGEEY